MRAPSPSRAFGSRFRSIFGRTNTDPLAQDHVGGELGSRAARGALSALLTQWSRFVVQTASTVVLAHLLLPTDFGLVAMVTALLGFGDALWNIGLQAATIQRREITHGQVNFFFWLQSFLGVALTAITCALAFLIIGFYHQPVLYPIVFVLSARFAISGMMAQHQAVLARQMRFTALAIYDLVSLSAGVVVAIVVAALTASYWALAIQNLVVPVVLFGLYWYASGWVPTRPRREPGVGPLLKFGINLGFSGILNYAGSNADNVLIGKVLGAAPLGEYSRAYNLLLLPIRQIQVPLRRVAIPVLSYLQDDADRYRRYYRTAASGLCLLAMPALATLAALSHEVIAIMLGPHWGDVAPVFQVLAIAGTLQVLGNTSGWILISVGRAGRMATWSLFSQPILVGSFFAGIQWGVVGVAWAYTITSLVLLVPGFVWAVRHSPLRLADVFASGWRPVAIATACFGAAYWVHLTLPHANPALVVLGGGAAAGAILGVAALWWPPIHSTVRDIGGAVLRRRGHNAIPTDRREATPEEAAEP